jgi:hypothetical protein
MRVASFNVESLFDRAKALSLPTWEDGRKILEAYAETNALLNEPVYTLARVRRPRFRVESRRVTASRMYQGELSLEQANPGSRSDSMSPDRGA